MKRGFLNKSKVAKGGLLRQDPLAASSSNSSSPSDVESLAKAFQNLLRETGGGESSALLSQKIQDVLRGSSISQADLDQQRKMQDELFKGGKKMEYGKVKTVAIPEDYKPANIPVVPLDSKKTDHGPDTMILTTIPSKPTAGKGRLDPDGYSEWLVYGPTKAKVVNSPGYPKPVPKPKASYGTQPSYVVKSTPNMGLGVFATRDIEMGELIFAERPLLVSPASNIGVSMRVDQKMEEYDMKTQVAIMMMEWERLLELAVGRMEPKDKEAFMELANSHKDDGSGPILGILRTNGFMVGSNVYDGLEARADGGNAYSGVIKIGSRINHSCMPNVRVYFSTPSFSFQCSAMIDIKAGEELFYSYCGVGQSVARRQAELAPYGIVCSCPACKHATPETDKFRTEYKTLANNHIYNLLNVLASSNFKRAAENVIEPVVKLKDAFIREGLHYTSEYKGLILVIQRLYEGAGKKEKARVYMEEYKRYEISEMVNGVMVLKVPEY